MFDVVVFGRLTGARLELDILLEQDPSVFFAQGLSCDFPWAVSVCVHAHACARVCVHIDLCQIFFLSALRN